MGKTIVTLENWSVVFRDNDPHTPPEMCRPALHGQVYSHTRFLDGTEVTTSTVKDKIGDNLVTESGTIYHLGVVDPNYERHFPNAKERVLGSVKKKTKVDSDPWEPWMGDLNYE